jgi:homoserine kinase type II
MADVAKVRPRDSDSRKGNGVAVHTQLEPHEITAFLADYGIASVESVAGVAEGSIHTTYRIVASGGTRYLRLTEGLPAAAVDFELALLRHLSERGLPVPAPVLGAGGALRGRLRDRPAVLFEALPGRSRPPEALGSAGLAGIGAFLGALHRLAEDFPHARPNPYAPEIIAGWLRALRDLPEGRLDPEIAAALPALSASLEAAGGFVEVAGPEATGICHADLFPDNVLWEGEALSGVLDFEMACTAPRILDLAVALLVWAWDAEAKILDGARCRALAGAYTAARPPGPGERRALFDACRFVSVRYAVTRIRDFHLSALPAERLVRKDWRDYRDRLDHLEATGPDALAERVGG